MSSSPKKPARKARTEAGANIPKIWNGLIYSQLLSEFTRKMEMAYESLDHASHAGKISKASNVKEASTPRPRDKMALANSSAKKSQLFKAFKSGRKLIGDLSKGQPKLASLAGSIDESATTFHSSQIECVRQLSFLLPRADDSGHMTWPPPVPAHLAINAFVSLSLRIHTEKPTLPPKAVMRAAASKTLVPVLAYWLCVSGISGRANFHGIKTLKAAFHGHQLPKLNEDDPDTLVNELAWQRVATVLQNVSKATFGEEAISLLGEVNDLIEGHLENPHGGRLWSMMGKLNGTPPGANLLVVFECLHEIELSKPADLEQRLHDSTYYCSRIRYEAVRLGHYDDDFKAAAAKGVDSIEEAIKASQGFPPEKKLSMAFILSRRTLLSDDDDQKAINSKQVIAKMTGDLLAEVSREAKGRPALKEIADRYQLGFRTNPRFIKHIPSMEMLEGDLAAYERIATAGNKSVPKLLLDVFKARIAWAKSLAGLKIDTVEEVLVPYASSAEALFKAIETDKKGDAFESEAPIWILPELSVLVWLGDDFGSRIEVTKRLGAGAADMSDIHRKLENASTILTRIAETEFGVYYHHAAERRRIIKGMLHFADYIGEDRRRS